MKLAGIILLVAGGLLMLCVPLSMVWTFQQMADSSSSPAPRDLANGLSQSVVYGIWALPVGLAGLVLLVVGILSDPKRKKPADRDDA